VPPDHGVLDEALAVLQGAYAKRTGLPGGRTGSIAVVQRFGSGLNLNVHYHILMVDGCYSRYDDGALRWEGAPAPTTVEVEALIEQIARSAETRLAGQGLGPEDERLDEDDTDARIHAAAIAGHSAFETRRRTQRIGGREITLPPLCATFGGYTRHAGVAIGADDRGALERLCRYLLRPPVARERLRLLDGRRVALLLKRRWSDGSSEKVFTYEELVERLATFVPPSRKNQVFYGGVFAPGSKLRADVVRKRPRRRATKRLVRADRRARGSRWVSWAELLERTFAVDGFRCSGCGGPMVLRAVVIGHTAAHKVLADLSRGAAGPP